jgi:hypothetical protein
MLKILRRACLVALVLVASLSIAAYIRSFWKSDEIIYDVNENNVRVWRYSLVSDRGRIGVMTGYFELDPALVPVNPDVPEEARRKRRRVILHAAQDPPGNLELWDSLWVSGGHSQYERNHWRYDMWTSYFPVWLICVICGGPALIALMRSRRRRIKRMLGKCKRCGYDLRGTNGFCPECGPMPSKRRASASAPHRYNPLEGATRFLTEQEARPRTPASAPAKPVQNPPIDVEWQEPQSPAALAARIAEIVCDLPDEPD